MEYKIGDITFSKDTQYDKVLYWKLFRIFYALEHTTEELDYASCVTGKYGALLYRNVIDGKTTEDLYKKLLNETKLWGVEVNNIKQVMNIEVNDILESYYDRIIKSIPQNILEKIQNIELFKLGYIEKNVYDELMTFKKDLRDWLENPKGTNVHYDIDGETPVLALDFHDQIFKIKKANSKLELIGDEYIVLNDGKAIITNYQNLEIINDYKNETNYEFNNIEGYCIYGVGIKDSELKEFLLEMNNQKVSEIIIETKEEPNKLFSFDCKEFQNKDVCIKKIKARLSIPEYFENKWSSLNFALDDLSWIEASNIVIEFLNYDLAFKEDKKEKNNFYHLVEDVKYYWISETIDYFKGKGIVHNSYKNVVIYNVDYKKSFSYDE